MSDFIDTMQERGFYHQASDLEGLRAKLKSGVQSAYIGYDPTARSLHIGNLMGIMMLKWFQQCGHRPVTLMGGGTVLAGDPSGKDETRKLLDRKDIEENIASIKPTFAKFLKYGSGKTDAVMVNNADWLCDLNYVEFLREVGPHFSINRMIKMDSVKLRLEREQSLSFLEFNYMIMQGYDFVKLYDLHKVTIQMGGSDQWGNIIAGVELGQRMKRPELYAFTTPLLTTGSGAKMGKSADGAIWLNEDLCSPYEYYQYWRNTEDEDVVRWLKIYTMLPMDEIAKLAKLQGQEINEAKKVLAFEATKLCHGEKKAQEAADTACKTFEEGHRAGALPTLYIKRDVLNEDLSLIYILFKAQVFESRSSGRRLIEQGGVKVNGNKVEKTTDTLPMVGVPLNSDAFDVQIGKKTFYLVKIED